MSSTIFNSFSQNIANNQSKQTNPVIVWNTLVTELGSKEKLSPPEFARLYALVHISIYDSLLATQNFSNTEFQIAVITNAAAGILNYLFPNYSYQINKTKDILISDLISYYDTSLTQKGLYLGNKISQSVINYSNDDNSNNKWNSKIPKGKCIWNGTNPILPGAGFWKTYILKSGAEIQPIKPIPCNSSEYLLDLNITYYASVNRTPQQISAIHYWGNKSPPAIWNNILNDFIEFYNMDLFDAAYASVYLNVGIYDAFVSCWYSKYTYWTARPFQTITNITTEIPTPNFPGYPSGHSVISTVASKVLGEIFPLENKDLEELALQASLSRIWAGIHFIQDVSMGIRQGLDISQKIIQDMHINPHFFIYKT
jgi:PAP2 superfamily protein